MCFKYEQSYIFFSVMSFVAEDFKRIVGFSFKSEVLQYLAHYMSVRSAVEQGTEMLELDCHFTKDGHVVVSHDENLLRQTGHDATVSSLDLKVGGRILQHCFLGQRSQQSCGGVWWFLSVHQC